MVSVNLKFTRQNDGYAQLSLLGAGLELAEEAAPPTTDFQGASGAVQCTLERLRAASRRPERLSTDSQGIAAATVTHDTAALELAAACHPVLPGTPPP